MKIEGSKMVHIRSLLMALSIIFFVTGCTPMVFGVPEEQWNRMPPEQQNTVRGAYLERERLREERRLVDARARERAEQQRLLRAQQEAANSPPVKTVVVVSPPEHIVVTMSEGTGVINGKRGALQPTTFEMRSGELRMVEIDIASGRRFYRGDLGVSYRDGVLRLDLKDRYNEPTAAKMAFVPAWLKDGAFYSVSTDGPRLLRGTKVDVKSVGHRGPHGKQVYIEHEQAARVSPTNPARSSGYENSAGPVAITPPAPAIAAYREPFKEGRVSSAPPQPMSSITRETHTAPVVRSPQAPAPSNIAAYNEPFKNGGLTSAPPPPAQRADNKVVISGAPVTPVARVAPIAAPEHIVVTLSGGTAIIDGKRRVLESANFGIRNGEFQKQVIHGRTGKRAYSSQINASYSNGLLKLDFAESEDDAKAARINFSSEWASGSADYILNSDGPLSLRGAKLKVESVSQ